jgi:hypothetical protein
MIGSSIWLCAGPKCGFWASLGDIFSDRLPRLALTEVGKPHHAAAFGCSSIRNGHFALDVGDDPFAKRV